MAACITAHLLDTSLSALAEVAFRVGDAEENRVSAQPTQSSQDLLSCAVVIRRLSSQETDSLSATQCTVKSLYELQ